MAGLPWMWPTEPPDTVLLDVMMPEMDGFETCRRLKQQDATRNIPILMVSALGDRNNRLEGISAGAVDFITKPIDVRDMLLRVGNAVAGKRSLDDIRDSYLKLKQLEEERERMMRRVVHDMRSPLAGISGNLQLLQMLVADRLSDEEKSFLQNSLESTEQLNRQVDALLSPGKN
jgi:two-component system sensor histidine kinase/response regulator